MIITHSLFNAALARLPSPEVYISAFAVAKSFMHVAESPMMMIRQTVTTLVEDRESYYRVRNFFIILGVLIVLTFAVIVLAGLARWIFNNIMGLEGKVLDEAVTILKVLIIFPGAVTFRGFFQGTAIKLRATPLLTISTIIRIIFISLIVVYIRQLIEVIPPAIMAGLMFLCAAAVETIVIFLGSKIAIGDIVGNLDMIKKNNYIYQKMQDIGKAEGEYKSECDGENDQLEPYGGIRDSVEELTYRTILYFFIPLALTSFIKNLALPIINTGLGRTHSPERAISVYAVAWGLGTIVTSTLNMFHQVPLNFMEDDDSDKLNIRQIRKFALYLGIILSAIIAFISFTGTGYYILRNVIGATHEISVLAVDVLKIMIILPPIIAIREFYWGILMKKRMTKYIGRGKTANLAVLLLSITVMALINPSNPAIIGIVGMICCEAAEAVYLYIINKRAAA